MTPKCRASILTLNSFDHDWDGALFDNEAEARVALYRERPFRVRVNVLRVSYIGVIEVQSAERETPSR